MMKVCMKTECGSLCWFSMNLWNDGNEVLKVWNMIKVDEFGWWEWVMNLYVENLEEVDKLWFWWKVYMFCVPYVYLVYVW